MLALKEKGTSRLMGLVRASRPHLEVILPESCDKDMIRDGIERTAPSKVGQRAWWLIQMLASVPPSVWPQTWHKTPADLLRAAAESEWKQVLFEGWERAALTRIPADVQDALITILSEKTLPIPELGEAVQAVKGFNVIATANNRDRGVNELSSALKRRFNTVVFPLPESADEEVEIVRPSGAGIARAP